MKTLKYLIPTLLAVFAMMVSCSDSDDPTYLDEVQVSSSYVAIPIEGGSTSITVTASSAWEITDAPDWLTISPLAGEAGTVTITFSAEEASDGRTATVYLKCDGKTQNINVIQGVTTISEATCAEVIAGPDSKTYRVTGTVTSIVNTTYGNWYLADETGEIYIYGTLDAKGATKNFSSLGLEVGDIVTVQGPKTTYKGTVELVDVTVVSITKSLIKVDSLSTDTIPLEGGNTVAYLTCKGDGVNVDIPDDAKDWLAISSITSGTNPTVTFTAQPNTGGDRNTTVTFKTYLDGAEYTSEVTIYQAGAIVECAVSEFLAAATGDTQYRLTGVIQSVKNTTYGNFYLRDYSGQTYVYGLGSKGDFESIGLKAGDIITLVGKRGEYKGEAQMTGGQYESHISVTECSIADFLDKEDSNDVYYMVTGVITEIANDTYGNLYLSDGTNTLYVYGCYPGYGATGDARKNFLESADIEVGDTLTMIGYKSTYKGTIELCGGIYYSHTKAE